jgi:CheY-like chemotaxis protein
LTVAGAAPEPESADTPPGRCRRRERTVDLPRLGALLVDAGAVGADEVGPVVQAGDAGRLQALLKRHEATVAELLAERHQRPCVILGLSTIDVTLLDSLPVPWLQAEEMLPLASRAESLTVAVVDPVAAERTLQDLGVQTGRHIVPVVVTPLLLEQAIDDAARAFAAGEQVLRGAQAASPDVDLVLARPPLRAPPAKLPRPDSVARALGAVLDETPVASALKGPIVGAVRLKQVQVSASVTPLSPPDGVAPVLAPPVLEERPPPPRPATRRPFALVVEDDEAIGALLCRMLVADGCDAEHLTSGDGVAGALRVRRPDLILLDAMLPGVHGFEICAALKASPDWRSVPIAMVSAVYRSFDQVKEIHERHGADAFIEKPFQLEHVRRVVADLLRRPPPLEVRHEARELSAARTRALVDHHLLIGDVEGATAIVDRWLAAEPLSARAWLERGHLAVAAADHFRALQAYELAALYDRRLFLAQVSLASLSAQLGFQRKAHDAWLKAAACAPDAATADQIRRALAG